MKKFNIKSLSIAFIFITLLFVSCNQTDELIPEASGFLITSRKSPPVVEATETTANETETPEVETVTGGSQHSSNDWNSRLY